MKKLIAASFVALAVMTTNHVTASSNSTSISIQIQSKTGTFKVYGNCGMCKKRIEASLKDVEGIESATWDVKTKMISVTYDAEVISLQKIKETIAAVGHDTDETQASDKVYSKLPGCCQYDRSK